MRLESHIDLKNSRPLNPHLKSNDPAILAMIEQLWTSHFQAAFAPESSRGRRATSEPRAQFAVLVLNLLKCWTCDPDACLAVPMAVANYRPSSRYNEQGLSVRLPELVRHANDVGLVGLKRGSEAAQRVTRIWPLEPLLVAFAKLSVQDHHIREAEDQECIILSSGNGRYLEYGDTPEIVQMRGHLKAYNVLLGRTFIDMPDQAAPVVTVTKEDGSKRLVELSQSGKFVKRVFYRGSFELGGRFHGGFWQQLPKEHRGKLHLNGKAVVEDDYKGLHITLLYGLERVRIPTREPYLLDNVHSSYTPKQLKPWVKSLALMAINASSKKAAFMAFRSEQPVGSPAKRFTDAELDMLLQAFLERHRPIAKHMLSDKGVELMAIDGRITARIIDHFTAKGIPVLTVHDSYLIDVNHTVELRHVMKEAISSEIPGITSWITREGQAVGYDQMDKLVARGRSRSELIGRLPRVRSCEAYVLRRLSFEGWLEQQGLLLPES